MADKYNRFLASTPNVFRPFDGSDVRAADWLANVPNPIINALLLGFAQGDQEVSNAIQETKASLFVQTASNQFLDVLASSFGVARPAALGLPDPAFRDLIPPLSLQAKQVRTSFYNAMDAFWGPEFSRANIGTDQVGIFDTFDLRTNDVLSFQVDTRTLQTVVVRATDLQNQGAMTVNEFSVLLNNNLTGTTNEIIRDPINDRQFIRLLTTTPGLRGSLQFTVARPNSVVVPIIFPTNKSELIGQAQRTVIYEIRPNELTIEVPAFIPSLARGLRGSEHLHNGPLLAQLIERGTALSVGLPADVLSQEPTEVLPNNTLVIPNGTNVTVSSVITNTMTLQSNGGLTGLSISGADPIFTLSGTIDAARAEDVYRVVVRATKTEVLTSSDPAVYPNPTPIVTTADFPIFVRVVADIANVTDAQTWVGSFLYDPNGLESSFTITGQSARIVGDTTSGGSGLTAGEVHPRITVESTTNTLPTDSGLAIVGFGSSSQEPALVLYRGRANQSVIEVDPSFVFSNTHPEGTFINIVSAASPFVPDRQGNAYPVYLTSSTNAREIILDILRTLAAAGVFLNFVILAPTYKYLIDNPYLTTDDRPTS